MKKFNLFNLMICFMTLFFVSIFCGNIALADTWTKVYGSDSTDDIYSIELTSDGYILNGYTTAGAFGDLKGISVKLDNNGNKEWVKTFGKESASDNVFDILKSIDTFSDGEVTSDGGYIIAGDSTSYSATDDYESLIIKFDSEGNEEWAKTYINGYKNNSALSIKEVSDGYIITGFTNNFGVPSNKIFVFKIDSSGNVSWARVFGVVNFIDRQTDSGGVIEVSDGYIISGRTNDGTSFIPVFLKLDKNGNKLWAKTITLSSGYDVLNGIIETSDGQYIGTGFMSSDGNIELVVFKMDGNGNKLWAKNYGGTETDVGLSIVENASGEFIVAGYTKSFGAIEMDGFIMKIDSVGNMLLTRTFGGDGNDLISEIHKTSDGYVSVGTAASFSGGNNDVMVLKFDENLNIQSCDTNFNVINIASINSSVILTNTVAVSVSSFHNINGDMIISDIDPEGTDSDLEDVFACGVDNTSPTLVTEAWIPDDTTGIEIIDGGVVNLDDIDEAGEFVTIYSNALDASGIQDHRIRWWKNGVLQTGGNWITGGLHSFTINGPLNDGDIIKYQAQATDNAIIPNTGYDPIDGVLRYSFTIREACAIDSIPDLIMIGDSDSYTFGASVSLDGDVNGDGYDDIIVAHGYSDATSASSDVEKAYIYFGGPLSDNVADMVLDNNNASDDGTVSSGDVNGDGFDDVVVGNPGKNTAYIYFGGSPMDNIVDVTLVTGNNNGESVDATGDVNNDGFNDVIIESRTGLDEAYLFYGGSSMNGIADLAFLNSGGFDVPRVSFAGDVNGDGYDDILIGNDFYDRAYLYYGGSPMNNGVDITFTDAAFVDQERVSSAGDVNNDGFDDILLASPWEGIGVPNWVYLYYGSDAMSSSYTNLEADLSFTNPDWVFFLDISYGNLNGDLYSDIIISDIEEKKAYIYYGGSAMDNVADVTINGPDDSYWGWSTSLGNFDDSGFDEIVIGAQFANAGGINRGQASVYKCLPPNTPPTQPVVSLNPFPKASSADDLICSITSASTDIEGDSITYTYEWLEGGVVQGGLTVFNSTFLNNTLSSVNTFSGDNWQCQATPNDGTENGLVSAVSNSVLINTLPIMTSVTITPDSAHTNDDLTANPNATDTDSDPITYSYQWKKNGINVGGNSQILSSVNFDKNDDITVTVTPSDGIQDGLSLTSAVLTILNSPPTMPIISISPLAPVSPSSDLMCLIDSVSTDIDGDIITYEFEWFKNDIFQPLLNTNTVNFINTSIGESWKCKITPNDTTDLGDVAESLPVIIENTFPTKPTVSISPNPAYEDKDLFCSATDSTDVDGDSISYNYEWFVDDGTGYLSSGIIVNSISSSDTTAGESWKCVVTPNDGIADGPFGFGETIILPLTASDFPSVIIQAEDKNNNLINNGVSIDKDLTDLVTITSSASDDSSIVNHKILFTDNNWASTYYDSDTTTLCGSNVLCSINICDKLSCPLPVDTVIKYKSEATDDNIPPQTTYGDESLFRTIAIFGPNNSPTVDTLSVIEPDYCENDLDAIMFYWNFDDAEDRDAYDVPLQTAFQFEINNGIVSCSTGKVSNTTGLIIGLDTSLTGSDIKSFGGNCNNILRYGVSDYNVKVTVWDSSDSSAFSEVTFNLSIPTHKLPFPKFSYLPETPLLFENITFDPLDPSEKSKVFGGTSIEKFDWVYGDSSGPEISGVADANGGKVTHFYSSEGNYTVKLKVTDSDDYYCSLAQNINIEFNNPIWIETKP